MRSYWSRAGLESHVRCLIRRHPDTQGEGHVKIDPHQETAAAWGPSQAVSAHQSRKRQEGPLIEPQGDMAPWHFVLGLLAPRTTREERINSCCFMPKKKKKKKIISKLQRIQEYQSKISSAFIFCRVRKNSFLLLIYNIFKSQSTQGMWNFSWCYPRRIVWKPLGAEKFNQAGRKGDCSLFSTHLSRFHIWATEF